MANNVEGNLDGDNAIQENDGKNGNVVILQENHI